MTFDEAISRWVLLGDALRFELPAKTTAALLILRMRYSKAVKEFETMRDDAQGSSAGDKDSLLRELLVRPCEVQAEALSAGAFEDVVGAAQKQSVIKSQLYVDDKGAPMDMPVMAWLERFTTLTSVN